MNKQNKTERKNRLNLTLKYPSDQYFSIKKLMELNKDFVPITLRVHVNDLLKNKKITQIGTTPSGKGRPQLIFSEFPVKQSIIESARNDGVMLHSSFNSVTITSVEQKQEENKTSSSTIQTTVPDKVVTTV